MLLSLLGAGRGWAAADGLVNLTAEEHAWIAAHPVVRVGHDQTYAPYAFPDDKGGLVGIDLDFLAHIERRTGLRFKNETRRDWAQVLEAFAAGEVDVLMSLGYLPERESFLIYSQPYGYAPDVIVTRDDAPHLFDLGELKDRRIALVRGYDSLRKELRQVAPGAIVVEYPTTEAALLGVAGGEVFGAVADVVNSSYLVKTRRLTNLRLGSVIGGTGANEIRLGVQKSQPVLAGIIDKALADITPAERHQISNRWVAVAVADDRWWARAARIGATVAAIVLVTLLLLFLHNRRLARELDERRRVQAELEQTRDRLAQLSEEKSELLRMVTHDLRSPLTGLMLGIDLLQLDDRGTVDARESLTQMRAAAQQMMRLTNDLVDANVVEAGRHNFSMVPVDAVALFREAVTGLTDVAARKRIQLRLITTESVRAIWSDQTALRQVADNLISNAVKFSPAGSAVEVELRLSATALRVEVRDHGPGINPANREQIFTQYGQGEARPTGGEKSTGLGLWIVQRIVTGLGGRVWCESTPGQGATFIVELPQAQAGGAA